MTFLALLRWSPFFGRKHIPSGLGTFSYVSAPTHWRTCCGFLPKKECEIERSQLSKNKSQAKKNGKLPPDTHTHKEKPGDSADSFPNLIHLAFTTCVDLFQGINHIGNLNKARINHLFLLLKVVNKILHIVNGAFPFRTSSRFIKHGFSFFLSKEGMSGRRAKCLALFMQKVENRKNLKLTTRRGALTLNRKPKITTLTEDKVVGERLNAFDNAILVRKRRNTLRTKRVIVSCVL